ncbi:WhiB family transcriptional regulator [Pseudonocardia sp. C8]|uniref:WhiB family transcriptional regulator n=1 Tax=Pseudonocardia sp. C8 TaxID=2762759 RepID=UPI001642AD47|nr:WhiB family transcriptional regulator [Pseudonocardia sp. C8]MBC3191680.1 WhiB family transcriptional regulator [Pseudonocardia sp. C8]
MDWRDEARCRTADPELFFPEPGRGQQTRRQVARAVAICHTCPVRTPCLEWAIRHREQFGVWGGVTARARRAMGPGHALPPVAVKLEITSDMSTKERRAVGVALLARGVRRAEVADRVGVTERTVDRWIAAGKRRGRARQCPSRRRDVGPGPACALPSSSERQDGSGGGRRAG